PLRRGRLARGGGPGAGGGGGGRGRRRTTAAGKKAIPPERAPKQTPAATTGGRAGRLLPERGGRCGRGWSIAPGLRRGGRARPVARGGRGGLRLAGLAEARLLVGGRALAQTVGALALAQATLEPQRTCEVRDGLGGLVLLAIGGAAQQQRLGHAGRG